MTFHRIKEGLKFNAAIALFLVVGSNVKAQLYNDFAESKKEVIFIEEFNEIPLSTFKVKGNKTKVEEGRLIGRHNELSSTKAFNLETVENFEIEVNVKHEILYQSSFKIIWERAPKSGKYDNPNLLYMRHLDKDVIFSAAQFGPNGLLKIEKPGFAYYLNTNGFNKYTFRYISGKYQFFINEKFVGELIYKLSGPQVLKIRPYSTKYELDMLRVSILR